MVLFGLPDGEVVAINPEHVSAVALKGVGPAERKEPLTLIFTGDEDPWEVQGTVVEVMERLSRGPESEEDPEFIAHPEIDE